jgi:type IV secretory pathway VirB6-like protein
MLYVKLIIINFILLTSILTEVKASIKWEGEALKRREQQCSGLDEINISCGFAAALSFYNPFLAVTGPTCGGYVVAFKEKLSKQFRKARKFRSNSKIINHQDIDNNGLNDYGVDNAAQDCSALRSIQNPATKENFTLDEISRMKGCRLNIKGEIEGLTYELYDEELDCNRKALDGQENKTAISVEYYEEDDEKRELCILANQCRDVMGEKLCVYELDGLICAEMVFCDAENMNSLFGILNYQAISGKVDNGTESDKNGNGAVISCSELCKYDEDENRWVYFNENEDLDESQSCLDKYKNCSIECPNYESCVSNGEVEEDCEPVLLDKAICGFDYNKNYLAHCIPSKNKSLKSVFEIPHIISPYCTDEAQIKDINGNAISAFTGRAVRCLDQTIRNIMHGSALSLDAEKRTIGYKCVGGDGALVQNPVECEYGLIKKFQIISQEIVTIILILAVVMFGFLITFGLISEKKQILKYIFSFSIVLYFVNGNAWKDGLYDTLMVTGADLALIIFNDIDYGIKIKRDKEGGEFTIPSHYSCTTEGNLGPDKIHYLLEDERRYKIWDLLDCRWKTFFGDRGGAKNSASPQILRTASIGWLAILFAFFILILTIPAMILIFVAIGLKAIFMYVSAMVTISLLVFISPLVIPLMLFNNDKIKGIFKSWVQHLIGYSLVPLIIYLMLAIFFKGIDIAMYGTKEFDVFTELEDGSVTVTDNCSDIYIPCLNHKLEDKYYEIDVIGNKLTWFDLSTIQKVMIALLRMLFVFIVMFMIFNYISKSLISTLLQVQVVDDDIVTQMKNAITKTLKYSKSMAKGTYKVGKKSYKNASGQNDNEYGTKGVKFKDND